MTTHFLMSVHGDNGPQLGTSFLVTVTDQREPTLYMYEYKKQPMFICTSHKVYGTMHLLSWIFLTNGWYVNTPWLITLWHFKIACLPAFFSQIIISASTNCNVLSHFKFDWLLYETGKWLRGVTAIILRWYNYYLSLGDKLEVLYDMVVLFYTDTVKFLDTVSW